MAWAASVFGVWRGPPLIFSPWHSPQFWISEGVRARDSPGQPHAIVVIDKKRLKFKRGHRATRQCDITYIQRIYDAYKCHGTHIGHFGRFSIFYSPGRVAVSYIRSMPI